MDVMFACLQSAGTFPDSRVWLNVRVRNGVIWSAASYSTLDGTRSVPMAFVMSKVFKSLFTPFSVTVSFPISGMEPSTSSGISSMFSFVNTLRYCWFNISVFPLLSITSSPELFIKADMLTIFVC